MGRASRRKRERRASPLLEAFDRAYDRSAALEPGGDVSLSPLEDDALSLALYGRTRRDGDRRRR